MGWASAGDIIDPQVPIMNRAIENGELEESKAIELLSNLIDKLRDNDWDTEYVTLSTFSHLPWVVKAFAQNNVFLTDEAKLPSKAQVHRAVKSIFDDNCQTWYDLSESYPRDLYVGKITDAIATLFRLDDD